MEKQTTPIGKNYWRGNGIYQTEYDELYDKLVPSSGEAPTVHGELIRGISRLTYDYYIMVMQCREAFVIMKL